MMSSDPEYKDQIVVEIKPNQTLNLQLKAKKKEWTIKGTVSNSETNDKIGGARVDLYRTKVKLTKPLNCYEEPDTSSTMLSSVDRFEYPVLEIKLNHPNNDTDYVKIQSQDLGPGEGWICSRWQKNHYALLYDKKEKENVTSTSAAGVYEIKVNYMTLYRLCFILKNYFDATSDRILPPKEDMEVKMEPSQNNILEATIIDRLSDFAGFSYTKSNAKYPYEKIANWNIPEILQAGTKKNNCTTFTEALLVKAWEDALGVSFNWSLNKHNQWQIVNQTCNSRFSPIDAVVESGMGVEVDDDDEFPQPWTIMQGFRNAANSGSPSCFAGHNLIIVDVHKESERILTLESNAKLNNAGVVICDIYEMNGPGFRMLGDIDDFPEFTPPKDWWKNTDLPNWDNIKSKYPYRKMAKLKVYDLQWLKKVI